MQIIKTLAFHFVSFSLGMFVTHAEVLYYQPFSNSNSPGWYSRTINDFFVSFAQSWSVTPRLDGDPPQQFARYDILIPTLPNPEARWDGGFSGFAAGLTNLPQNWHLSFRAYVTNLDPFRVELAVFDTLWPVFGQPPSQPPPVKTLTLWCYPTALGWQTLHLDRHSPSIAKQTYGRAAPILGLELRIGLASYDSETQPLSISQIGSHSFGLDEITLSAAPAQSALSVSVTATNTLVLSWPSSVAGLRVQTNSNLTTPHWDYWNVSPSDDGTTKSVVVAPSGVMFYRLKD